jgi:hypothetical protein
MFEPQPTTEVSEASQDWFLEEIKKNSKMDPSEVENLLKQDVETINDSNFTVIEKV